MKNQKIKKILIVTDYFYPHWTGLSKSLYYFVSAFDATVSCTVLTVRHSKKLKRKERIFRTIIFREKPLFSFSRAKYSLVLLWRFAKLMNKHNAVLINSPCTNVLPIAILAKLFRKKLYIFHQGDLILPVGIFNRFLEKVFDICSYPAFFLADKVSTYTKDYADHSRILRPFLAKCIPLIFPIPSVFCIKKGRQKKQSKIIFGFAGRFVEEKGFDILFRAIPQIVKILPHARFLYAGETDMGYEDFFASNKELYEQVKDNVEFLGLLDDKHLAKFYQEIDFLIVPSRSDCFSLVQAEAMVSGTPVIASDIPGLRVMVKKTGFGIVFKKENSQKLVEALMQAVKDKKKILKNYSNVLKFLDRKKNVRQIREFIES